MTKKVAYTEISGKLMELSGASYDVYKNFAHIAGYYESTLVSLIADLPAAKQREMMRVFQDRIEGLKSA